MTTKGVIAAGHPETVKAAAAVLDEGGNAFDAVLAAIFASKRAKRGQTGARSARKAAEIQATTLTADTNEKIIFNKGTVGAYERKMMALLDRTGIDYTLRE